MHVYNNETINPSIIGTANAINVIADVFVPYAFTFIVTAAVVVLPITSGDTALRGLRITVAEVFHLNQKPLKNRLIVIFPIAMGMLSLLVWAKMNNDSFSIFWRYFNLINQLITIPTFFYATVYLKEHGKNYFVTMLPGLLYVFITMTFLFNAKIGFDRDLSTSEIIAVVITLLSYLFLKNAYSNYKNKSKAVSSKEDVKQECLN